jgi:hypothetical protein
LNLIYTMAYGDDALQWAAVMVESLRRWGRFKGEIVVYSHKDYVIEGATVVCRPEVGAMWYLPVGKAFLGTTLEAAHYDKVVWMDSDIVAVGDINPLFELGSGFWAPYDRAVSPAKELKAQWGLDREVVVNSGMILGEGKDWNLFCRAWWNRIVERKVSGLCVRDMVDEPALNLLMQEGVVKVSVIPENWILLLYHAGQQLDQATKLVHCTALSKLWVMRTLVDLMKRNA